MILLSELFRRHTMKKVISVFLISIVIALHSTLTIFAGWQQENDRYYYVVDETNTRLQGEQLLNGKPYTFNDDGILILNGIHRDGLEDNILNLAYEEYAQRQTDIDYMLQYINEVRAATGAGALTLDFNMTIAAIYRSIEMEQYNYFSHYLDGKSRAIDVYLAQTKRPRLTFNLSENLFRSRTDYGTLLSLYSMQELGTNAINGYMASPGHYANLMDKSKLRVGIGIYLNSTNNRYYTTLLFLNEKVAA